MGSCACLQNDAFSCWLARQVASDAGPFVLDADQRCECICHAEARQDERDEEDARG